MTTLADTVIGVAAFAVAGLVGRDRPNANRGSRATGGTRSTVCIWSIPTDQTGHRECRHTDHCVCEGGHTHAITGRLVRRPVPLKAGLARRSWLRRYRSTPARSVPIGARPETTFGPPSRAPCHDGVG